MDQITCQHMHMRCTSAGVRCQDKLTNMHWGAHACLCGGGGALPARPVIDVVMEPEQCWQLVLYWDSHVILDSIKAAQHQIEDADRIPQGVGQLLDDNREAAGGKNSIDMSLCDS